MSARRQARAQGRLPPRPDTIRVLLLSCHSSTCCIFEVELRPDPKPIDATQAGWFRVLWGGIEAYFRCPAKARCRTQVRDRLTGRGCPKNTNARPEAGHSVG